MALGAEEFMRQAKELGFEPVLYEGSRVVFPFTVASGRFAKTALRLGLVVPGTFPNDPPSGPHISPPLLDLHPNNDLPHPAGGVHASEEFERIVGGKWQYWSRPCLGWGKRKKSVRTYLDFVDQLFASQ